MTSTSLRRSVRNLACRCVRLGNDALDLAVDLQGRLLGESPRSCGIAMSRNFGRLFPS